jgi:hypothetical protein
VTVLAFPLSVITAVVVLAGVDEEVAAFPLLDPGFVTLTPAVTDDGAEAAALDAADICCLNGSVLLKWLKEIS